MQKLGPEYDPKALTKVYSETYMEATRHEQLFEGVTELLETTFVQLLQLARVNVELIE